MSELRIKNIRSSFIWSLSYKLYIKRSIGNIRNTIFAVTREARVKGFLATIILFLQMLKHRKSVHFRNVMQSYTDLMTSSVTVLNVFRGQVFRFRIPIPNIQLAFRLATCVDLHRIASPFGPLGPLGTNFSSSIVAAPGVLRPACEEWVTHSHRRRVRTWCLRTAMIFLWAHSSVVGTLCRD